MEKLGYKIRRLFIENVKRIRMVEIIPKGNVVEITGANAQGKSSILDSIEYVLGGESGIPDEPIRKGEEKAVIILETDDFTATRTWTSNKKSYLTVAANTGKSPQKFLNDKINRLSFDPVSFMNMKPAEQEALLRKATGLNTSELETEKARIYEDRTVIGREVDRLKVFRNELGEPVYDLPDKEVNAQDIIDSISAISKMTDKRNQIVSSISTTKGHLVDLNRSIEMKEDHLRAEEEELNELNEAKKILKEKLAFMEKDIESVKVGDAVPLRGELLVIEEKNKAIRKNQQINKVRNEHEDVQAKYNDCTEDIKSIDKQISEKILNTKFPIEGLSVNEKGIIFNDIILEQASQAEKIKVGLGIAESLMSELQIILIKEGSLLDKESMKFIRSYAKIKDYQIWVERLDPTTKDAIIIEDGGVSTK